MVRESVLAVGCGGDGLGDLAASEFLDSVAEFVEVFGRGRDEGGGVF